MEELQRVARLSSEKPFPFVVGNERSGTTLLRAMLDSHPDLAVPSESYFLVPLLKEEFNLDAWIELLRDHRRFERWELPIEDVIEAYGREGVHDARGAVRVLYSTYAKARGKTRWGDKTPRYVRRIRGLANLLPEAHFIHIIRDGREVALSWLDAPFGPETVEEAAETWRQHVSTGRRAGNKHASGRYLEVRYEGLVADPEEVLREVCRFIDLAFDPAMLSYTDRAADIIGSTISPESHSRLQMSPTAGLRDWRTAMSPSDIRKFQEIAGALLTELGYESV